MVLLSSASKPGPAGSWLDTGAKLWARKVLLPPKSLCPSGERNCCGSKVVQRELAAAVHAVQRGGGGCLSLALSVVRREVLERQGQSWEEEEEAVAVGTLRVALGSCERLVHKMIS